MTTSRSEADRIIRIAAAVVVDAQGRTLLVRKRGTRAFMQAGGKLGAGESAAAALEREIREELGCGLMLSRPLGTARAAAANEEGWTVEADLFAVDLAGEVRPAAEIEEILWCAPEDAAALTLAPLTRDHVLPLVRSMLEPPGGWRVSA
jgi:8-oxo-dGTP pyrophosphatase MutT (NUDIX family)